MPVRVRFVLNKITGEVEEFLIDDQDRSLPELEHDRIARDIGELVARNPGLAPVSPSAPPPPVSRRQREGGPEQREADRTPDPPVATPLQGRG